MAFQLSPGVNVTEVDLTTVVPAVASSDGAFAGIFRWGPVGERVLVDSENKLVSQFGKPTNLNPETFFTAANFLNYGNRLYVSRAANTGGSTPSVALTGNTSSNVVVLTSGNTSGLTAGMYVYQSSNTSVFAPANTLTITAITNTTAIQLSSNAVAGNTATLYLANPQTAYNALAFPSGAFVGNLVNQIIKNQDDYTSKDGNFDTDVIFAAKYPGEIGNSLRVSMCETSSSFQSNVSITPNINFTIGSNTATAEYSGLSNASATTAAASFSVGDQILAGNSSIGNQYLKIAAISVNNSYNSNTLLTFSLTETYRLHTAFSSNTIQRNWEFFNVVDVAPGQSSYQLNNGNTSANDELHIVVVDNGGKFTGTPGTVLEVYKGLSAATDSQNLDGSTNYYKNVINDNSPYMWWTNDPTTISVNKTAASLASSTATAPKNITFSLGADGYNESNTSAFSVIAAAYDLFASAEQVDISLVLQGKPLGGSTSSGGVTVTGYQLANYIIDNICEKRKDCIALISPEKSLTLNAFGTQATNTVAWRNVLHSSSYAVMDSGYKYQYDRYNDLYRWIPMNGDVAGLCVRTDNTNDAWWSPAGFNRGQIKNLVKLAFNPTQADRDILYKNGVNPVVSFPGQGTILYGDKTLQAKPSAFDRINVRRLFIVLEKAISTAAKYSLFEFNDAFTRAQFKNLVTPYLRQIQGRRGITDFLVVCDDTNNTAQIIDTNQFVGDIYIKPARSINFIQLNFVAVGTGVQFSEVVGKF
jgi:hypothetical protein